MIVPITFDHLDNEQLIMLALSADFTGGEFRKLMQKRGWTARVYCQMTVWDESFKTFRLQSVITEQILAELVVFLDQPTRLMLRTAEGDSPTIEANTWLLRETPQVGVERAARSLLAEHNLRWECFADS